MIIITNFSLMFFKNPSNDRDWEFGQQKLQKIEFNKDNKIKIKDLRDYDWTKKGNEEKYINKEVNLDNLSGLEVGISHFSEKNEGIAHIFLIFNFDNDDNIALSIESRREKGEKFEILKGLTYDYELIYIWATKNDLLSLREKRDERVYIYPIKADIEKIKKILKSSLEKTNSLYEKPEFYHILFKNCATLIVDEVQKVSDLKFPMKEQIFEPGYSDKALFDMGLLKTKLKDFEKVKEKFLIEFE